MNQPAESSRSKKINFSEAKASDLPAIVALLADDPLGAKRESYEIPLPESYYQAFKEIDGDKNNYLIVAKIDENLIGTLQLTIIPNLTFKGGKRALIEGVRIAKGYRGSGLGKLLIEWAINKAKALNCHLIELTSNKSRADALKFYKKLGFVDSHEGFKLYLKD